VAISYYLRAESYSLWLIVFWGVVIGFAASGAYDYLIEPFKFWELLWRWVKRIVGVKIGSEPEEDYLSKSWENLNAERDRLAERQRELEQKEKELSQQEKKLKEKENRLIEMEVRIVNLEYEVAEKGRQLTRLKRKDKK
jgi:response regulator RpfG family c-di-GMP phosphodiesterase